MGIETALLAGGAALGAGGQIFSGFEKKKAAEDEARQIEEDAARQAQMRREEAIGTAKKQKLSFIKSGIDITPGSPIMMIAETKAKGQREAGFITERARKKSKGLKKAGRAALISGFLGAGSSALTGVGGVIK
jgi:hypothetical protein